MDVRAWGLGSLAVLPDELIDYLLRGLDAKALALISCTSKLLRVYALEEPLWLELHLARCKQPFQYRGSWRVTYLACNPACGMPGVTAADLGPAPQQPGFSSEALYRRWYRGHVDLSSFLPEAEAIPRVEAAAGLSAAEFEARYDAPRQPVVLQGLTRGWKVEDWALPALEARFGGRLFKASKPSGGRIRMALSAYLAYARAQHDEEPIYIFDATFGETVPELLAAYCVPRPFAWDLFSWAGYAREEYRWVVAGPPRSGASWHVDPAATSAWNTSLVGRKRWALYPPGRVPPGVEVSVDPSGEPDFATPTSLQWFLEVYPQLAPEDRPLEVVQHPGDTIFLPAGWWHCVLNLDMTVAVTQNFVSPANLEAVVAYLSLGAGSLFDEELVPAFLEQRQRAQQAGARGEAARQQPSGGVGQQAAEQAAQLGSSQYPAVLGWQHKEGAEAAACSDRGLTTNGSSPAAYTMARCSNGDWGADGGAGGASQLPSSLTSPSAPIPALSPSTSSSPSSSSSSYASEGSLASVSTLASSRSGAGGRAAAHLRRSVQGFERGGVLGRWLRALWAGEPALRPRVEELAERYTDVLTWRRRLQAVCDAAGLPPPQPHEAFPLAGGEAMVFQVGELILKVFNAHFYPPVLAMWQVEAAAYHSMHSAAAQQAAHGRASNGPSSSSSGGKDSALPRLVHIGVLAEPGPGLEGKEAAAEADTAGTTLDEGAAPAAARGRERSSSPGVLLPYILVTKSPGATLGSCMDTLSAEQWEALGAAAGRALADFHALPLPLRSSLTPPQPAACGCEMRCAGGSGGGVVPGAAGGCGASEGGAQAAGEACTAWFSHRGIVWSSLHGRLDKSAWSKVEAESRGQLAQEGNGGGTPGGTAQQPAGAQLPAGLRLFPSVPLALAAEAGDTGPAESPGEPAAKRARTEPTAAANGGAGAGAAAGGAAVSSPSTGRALFPPGDAAGAWGPFLSFLRYRRQRTLRGGPYGGVLPPHLAEQLEAYLPQDPATLLGFGGWPANNHAEASQLVNSGGRELPLPTWVHGDLTAENLLLQGLPGAGSDGGGGSCCVALIDFADSGQGDPLWDLVALYVRSFRCNTAALRHCLATYRQRQTELAQRQDEEGQGQSGSTARPLSMLAPRQLAPEHPAPVKQVDSPAAAAGAAQSAPSHPRHFSLSYIACCYTLLHELDLVESAVKARPQLWEVPTLEDFQRQLWGALDEPYRG